MIDEIPGVNGARAVTCKSEAIRRALHLTSHLSPLTPHERFGRGGFSFVELFLSMIVVALLLTLVAQILSDTQSVWNRTRARTMQFRDARVAFETMTRRLSQTTLNSYWGYRNGIDGNPVLYQRESELHFACGPATTLVGSTVDGRPTAGHGVFFQAPLSLTAGGQPQIERMEDLMNAWGYYVEFSSDLPRRPGFLARDTARNPERQRFRLMEFRLPAEKLDLYRLIDDPVNNLKPQLPWIEAQIAQPALYEWFTRHLNGNAEPIADNVLAFLVQPVIPRLNPNQATAAEQAIAAAPLYDTRRHQWENPGQPPGDLAKLTRHQLPPELRLTLVALDENSWQSLSDRDQQNAQSTLIGLVNERLFRRPADFATDIQQLQAQLRVHRLEHRIFTTTVPIRAARWTTEQN
jgi:uncharacterized protein (TIGR02599 family)